MLPVAMDLSPFLLQENKCGFREHSPYKPQIPKALVTRLWYVRKICNFCKMVTQTLSASNLRCFVALVAQIPLNEFVFRLQMYFIVINELDIIFFRYR